MTFPLGDADPSTDRVKVRVVNHVKTSALVEFAVVQETFHGRKWKPVVVADSTHDDEAHLHQYSRRTGKRLGQPELLTPITRIEDVAKGYELAYDRVVPRWAENKTRWHDG